MSMPSWFVPASRILVVVTLSAGWSASPEAQRSATTQARWSLVVEQRYGDRSGAELANPQTIAVDGEGRLYVADARPAAVKVFNADGSLLRVIGREGGGPGEYRNPWIAARGNRVVVHDPAQSRTSVFDTSGKFLKSWPTFCCHQNEIAVDRSMRVVVPAVLGSPSAGPEPVRSAPYLRYELEGSAVDTIRIRASGDEKLWTVPRRGADGKPGAGSTSVVVPFTPRQVFAWHPGGGYVSGWSGVMQLFRSTGGRDSVAFVADRAVPPRIPDNLRRAQVDSAVAVFSRMVDPATARNAVRLADVPTNAPAFTRLLIDEEGNVWARQLHGAERGTTRFRIFGPTGTDLGEAPLPASVPDWGGVAFGRGVVFVRTEDADGQPIVLRIRYTRAR